MLVGTQMVAKGHDFPDVALSVLLDADSTLRYPDFRAEERTFSLVAQLAGRSGRGERGGRVLIQTLAPDAIPIVAAAQHDAPGFLAGELERRREFGYPPFASLVAIEIAGAERGRPRRGRRPARRRDRPRAQLRLRAARAGAAIPATQPVPPPPADQDAPIRPGTWRRSAPCSSGRRSRRACAAERLRSTSIRNSGEPSGPF